MHLLYNPVIVLLGASVKNDGEKITSNKKNKMKHCNFKNCSIVDLQMLVSGVQQSDSVIYTHYIYLFFFRFFSHIGYYIVLSRVPRAMQ